MKVALKTIIIVGISAFLSMHVHAMQEMQEQSLREQEQEMAKLFPQTPEIEWAAQALTSPSARNGYFRLLISKSIEEHDQKKVKTLLEQALKQNFDINAQDIGGTLLHYAAYAHNNDPKNTIIQLLISKGANVNAVNCIEQTPLHCASTVEAARQLIEGGADVNAKDRYSRSPLSSAINFINLPLVRLLLKAPEIDTNREETREAVSKLFDSFPRAGTVKICNEYKKCNEIAKILTPYLITLTDLSVNKIGENINHYGDKLHVLPQDLQEKVNQRVVEQKEVDNRLLHAVSIGDDLATLKALGQGAQVNIQDEDGNTPLHFASSIDALELIQELLSKDAHVNSKNNVGDTPLLVAIESVYGSASGQERENLACLVQLIKAGANVNVKNNKNMTPLKSAIIADNVPVVKLLLKTPGIIVDRKEVKEAFDFRDKYLPMRHISSERQEMNKLLAPFLVQQ